MEGMLRRDADCFLKRVVMKLVKKRPQPYSQVEGFIKNTSILHWHTQRAAASTVPE